MNKYQRVEVLDILRMLAALSVVLYHYLYRGGLNGDFIDIDFGGYDGGFKYGYLGVQFFFVISGYMIAMSSRGRDWKKFIVSRVVRLYPAYWICLTITLSAMYLLGGERFDIDIVDGVLNFTMFSKLFGIPFADGAYWTLIYELIFYFWVLVSLLLRINLILIFVSVSLVGWVLEYTGYFPSVAVVFGGMFSSYFLVGLLFYYLRENPSSKFLLFGITFFSVLSAGQAYIQAANKIDNSGASIDPLFSVLFVLLIVLIFYIVSLGVLDKIRFKNAALIGAVSYPLYLLHQNVGYILINELSVFLGQWLTLGMVVLFVLFLAYIVARFLEPALAKPVRMMLGKI